MGNQCSMKCNRVRGVMEAGDQAAFDTNLVTLHTILTFHAHTQDEASSQGELQVSRVVGFRVFVPSCHCRAE